MTLLITAAGRVQRPGKSARAGGDQRGSNQARKRRKERLLATFGDGTVCPCIYCGTSLTFATVEADRIIAGDSYRFSNVIPACRKCNASRSDATIWSFAPNVARRLLRRGYVVSSR